MPASTPVVWFQAAGCTGCSVSLLNADYPSLRNLLLDEIVPGQAVALRFHLTLMGASGQPALEILERLPLEAAGNYLLVVEGAIPTGHARFGEIGGAPLSAKLSLLVERAMAVVATGSCAAYGGVPAARPNPTGALGVADFLRRSGQNLPVLAVPGCPPHPRWFMETLVHLLAFGIPSAEELDESGRLPAVFPALIHESCPRRADFDVGRFARAFGEHGCLYELGCKGPYTEANCPHHAWNSGVNWCIKAGHPCIGCCAPEFPDFPAPLFRKAWPQAMPRGSG